MEKSEMVAVGLVLALFLTGYFMNNDAVNNGGQDVVPDPVAAVGGLGTVTALPSISPSSSVVARVLVPGTGQIVKSGDRISVHYVGTLTTGEKFDSSLDSGTPFSFSVGSGEVIAGWDIGILGDGTPNLPPMRVGEKRHLTIPPELAYGERGTPGGPIPPSATLVFEVELLTIDKPTTPAL